MELRHLSAFLAVSEELNFRRAAARLHVSTSPLSRYIRDLEAELGATLFDRGTRHVRLTAAGEALVPHAVELIAGMEAAARSVDRAVGKSPELLVGVRSIPSAFQRTLVEDVLRPAVPGGRWRVMPVLSEIQLREIDRGAMAIGIGAHARAREGGRITTWPVLTEPVGVALPDLPRFRAIRTVRPADLEGLRIVTLSGPDADEAQTPAAQAYHSVTLGSVPGLDLIPGGIAALIQSGDYCAFMPITADSPWRRSIVGEGVIAKPLPASFPRIETSAAWLAARDTDGDLGPITAAIKAAYPVPAHLS